MSEENTNPFTQAIRDAEAQDVKPVNVDALYGMLPEHIEAELLRINKALLCQGTITIGLYHEMGYPRFAEVFGEKRAEQIQRIVSAHCLIDLHVAMHGILLPSMKELFQREDT